MFLSAFSFSRAFSSCCFFALFSLCAWMRMGWMVDPSKFVLCRSMCAKITAGAVCHLQTNCTCCYYRAYASTQRELGGINHPPHSHSCAQRKKSKKATARESTRKEKAKKNTHHQDCCISSSTHRKQRESEQLMSTWLVWLPRRNSQMQTQKPQYKQRAVTIVNIRGPDMVVSMVV